MVKMPGCKIFFLINVTKCSVFAPEIGSLEKYLTLLVVRWGDRCGGVDFFDINWWLLILDNITACNTGINAIGQSRV